MCFWKLDYVYSISDSCEKCFCVKTSTGEILKDKDALSYIKENKLYHYSTDVYNFLNNYLKRIENGKLTENSAFTLNGHPNFKDNLCKRTLYDCAFIESEDGLWLVKENSHSEMLTNGAGKQYEKWFIDYFTPYFLEDKTGNICIKK